ncbi:hypothetical protein [Roseitranquillus sediminis]|uniref:hypothetical protein n=1 Tax=Roseitranquillus sediminis TaxID=2809051 RepID=UPI001D0C40B7|nr:hypothetical protein [Roseitranquillus sediminis]MBM9593289.1 hypothetical protein [Roseitranquillus sediminis]
MRALALALLLPTSALADANPQLEALVQSRLPFYGIHVDVSDLSLRQVAAIHLAMASGGEGRLEKRRKIRAILRWEEE